MKYQALLALGRLDSVSSLLPDTSLFLYMYVRKEAVLSSMIECTQSSLSDLLLFELDHEPGVPLDDVREVSNYVAALDYGMRLLITLLLCEQKALQELMPIKAIRFVSTSGRSRTKSTTGVKRSIGGH